MCEGTVLPHWGHLLRCGACQRLAALRVRNRILDVLRFGTPMARVYESTFEEENNVEGLKRYLVFEFYASTFQRFNDSASAYPTHSNPVSASGLPPQSPVFSLCKHDCHPCRSADVLAG